MGHDTNLKSAVENLYKEITLSIPGMLVNAQHIHFPVPFNFFLFYL